MNFKITSIETDGDLITHAEFFVSLTDGTNTVEQQGTHQFTNPVMKTPLNEIKEQNIIDWIIQETTQDNVNIIQSNLEKQLVQVEKTALPWVFNTFKPFGG
jgi:hypothetical protein